MPKAKVTVLNVKKKVNPIERERDNTNDLEAAEMAAHGRYKGLRAPDTKIPGKKVTTPPRVETNIPS